MLDKIKKSFIESIETQISAAEMLPTAISQAATTLAQALLSNRILCFGNGISASHAHYFVANMIHQFEIVRPSLPAIALNSDVTLTTRNKDGTYDDMYAKQIRAFGLPEDVLFVISTCGNSNDSIQAVETAIDLKMSIVALTGNNGGKLSALLRAQDVEICVPSSRCIRIHEIHLLIINCLCDLIDHTLFSS